MKINNKFILPFLICAVLFLACGILTFMDDSAAGDAAAICLIPTAFLLMIVTLKLFGQKRQNQRGSDLNFEVPK